MIDKLKALIKEEKGMSIDKLKEVYKVGDFITGSLLFSNPDNKSYFATYWNCTEGNYVVAILFVILEDYYYVLTAYTSYIKDDKDKARFEKSCISELREIVYSSQNDVY